MQLSGTQLQFLSRLSKSPDGQMLLQVLQAKLAESDAKLRSATGSYAAVRGIIAAALSQIIDTLLFISISFYGVRPIGELMAGQMLTKVVLSFVLIPIVIAIVVNLGRKLDGKAASA